MLMSELLMWPSYSSLLDKRLLHESDSLQMAVTLKACLATNLQRVLLAEFQPAEDVMNTHVYPTRYSPPFFRVITKPNERLTFFPTNVGDNA